jgi:hypothetical protein
LNRSKDTKVIIEKLFFHPSVTSSVLDQNIFFIIPFSNTFSVCSSVNLESHVSHPYATSAAIIVLPSKGHLNIMLCADKNKFHVQKSNSLNYNSTFSLFSVFNTQTVRHVLKTSQYFLYIYERCITFFTKASHVPFYSTLH